MQRLAAGRPIVGARPQSLAFLFCREGIYHGVLAHDPSTLPCDAEYVIGRTVYELLDHPISEAIMRVVLKVFKTGKPQDFTYTLTTKFNPDFTKCRTAHVTLYDENTVLWDAIDITDITLLTGIISEMSDSERQVWRLSALGYAPREIANALDMGLRTVTRHRATSRERFGRLAPFPEK